MSFFFFSSRRRHTRFDCDWSSDVCSSDLQVIQVNALQLPQSQEYLFFERLLRSQPFQLLDGNFAARERRNVRGGLVRVGPALGSVERVRSRAEAEVSLAAPVFQVVPRFAGRNRPVGDFVVLVSSARQPFASALVEFRHRIVARQSLGAVTLSPGEHFPAEAAAFVNLHQVNRNVFGLQPQQLAERVFPTRAGLVWKSCDQVEAQVVESGLPQDLRRAEDVCAAMHSSGSNKFLVVERLNSQTDARESRGFPGSGLLLSDGFGIGFERDFCEVAAKAFADRVEDARERGRIEQARSSAAEINGVNNQRGEAAGKLDARGAKQRFVAVNLAANRFGVRRVQRGGKCAGVEIAVGAFRLAERNLNVDAEIHDASRRNVAQSAAAEKFFAAREKDREFSG